MLTEAGIVGRSVVYGAAAGGVVGAVGGFFLVPVIGAAAGAPIGALVGIVLGLVAATALSVAARFSIGDGTARVVAGGVSALAALALITVTVPPAPVVYALFPIAAGAVGALLGPTVLRGYPVAGIVGARHAGRVRGVLSQAPVFLVLATGVGATMGAIVGFLLGRDYLPTVVFAVVEGAVIGAAAAFALAGLCVLIAVPAHVVLGEVGRHAR